MSHETIDVQTPRGTMPVYLHRPVGDGPFPLVILFMDAPGIRPALHAHADRLAAAGYLAALPDLFYAIAPEDRPRPERLAARDPEEFRRMSAVVRRMDDDEVIEDTRLMLDAIAGRAAGGWGCVGFCMGGRFGLRAAETFGDDLAAASLLHPSGLVTEAPSSPHLAIDRVRAAIYFGFGENDHVTPPELIPPIREQLDEHGVSYRIEVIAGADHGYTMPGMPAYNETAAEQAWTGTLALLDECLR